jgi:hypothetical protein
MIQNCAYCSPNIDCLICDNNFYLDPALNICNSCYNLSKGCSSCKKLPTLIVNCTECVDGFSLYLSSNLIFNCIECNVTIINCLLCSSPSLCLACSNISFLNQYNTCSLCSLYMKNCEYCSNSSQCDNCK